MSDTKNVSFTMGSGVTDSVPSKIPGQISLDTDTSALYVDIDADNRLQVKDPTKMDKFGEVMLDIPYEGKTLNLVSLDESKVFALGIPDTNNLLNSNGYIIYNGYQVLNLNSDVKIELNSNSILHTCSSGSISIYDDLFSVTLSSVGNLRFGRVNGSTKFRLQLHHADNPTITSILTYIPTSPGVGTLSGIANPSIDSDAANKAYVDSTIHEAISWQDF